MEEEKLSLNTRRIRLKFFKKYFKHIRGTLRLLFFNIKTIKNKSHVNIKR